MINGYWWVKDKETGKVSVVKVDRDRVAFFGNDQEYPLAEIQEEYEFVEQLRPPLH